MTTHAASLDPSAAAILQPMLDAGEALVWAERPSLSRMLVSSIRQYLFTPLPMLSAAILAIALSLRAFGIQLTLLPVDPIAAVVITVLVMSPLLCGVICGLLYVVPFVTPLAYGATRSYFVICRGLIFRRLTRTPVSVVTRISLAPFAGRKVPVFQMHAGQQADFSFLHVAQPIATQAELQPLLQTQP